ncbi:preprotein translocase subunit YajC [Kineococcus sp. SYSU DK004]|uniref:preprotein translocase subunit YajC n=1 Tax=Kineococcus sp. SYSU DK004 TaxID=3383125 RepID=UPI003D7EE7DC
MGGGGGGQLVFLLLMVGLLVFMFSRTRKQQRAQQDLQNSVAPGSEVMTTSGAYGTVVDVEGDVVTLEVAPGVRTRWSRRAVARVVTAVGPAPDATAGTPEAVDPAEAGVDLRKDRPDEAGGATRA